MKLLAVSGGPDSMFLLYKYFKKNNKIIVAHVNYHKRKESNDDEQIVKKFCKNNNIVCKILNVKEDAKGNFQNWARKLRYDFFQKIYKEYNCTQLLVAHHKDDFLETALMQQKLKKTPKHWGIRQNIIINGMNIYRPFLYKYWKKQILSFLSKKHIKYAQDISNESNIYQRNIIRKELKEKKLREKEWLFHWFKISNSILKRKFKKIEKKYLNWKKMFFDIEYFQTLKKYKNEIIYEYLHDNFSDIKLSKNKIISLIDFINGFKKKSLFKINKDYFIKKEHNKLIKINL